MQKCGLQRRARNSIKKIKKIKKNRIWHSHFTPLPGRPCGADFYTFWLVGSNGRRNHLCQILSRLVKGLGGYGPPKSGVSHWLWMSLLLQCYALTCYTVKSLKKVNSFNFEAYWSIFPRLQGRTHQLLVLSLKWNKFCRPTLSFLLAQLLTISVPFFIFEIVFKL